VSAAEARDDAVLAPVAAAVLAASGEKRRLVRSPREVYDARSASVAARLESIRVRLEAHAKRAAANGSGWGHAGDLGHVDQVLEELEEFLR